MYVYEIIHSFLGTHIDDDDDDCLENKKKKVLKRKTNEFFRLGSETDCFFCLGFERIERCFSVEWIAH